MLLISDEELRKQDGKIVPLTDGEGNIIGEAELQYEDGKLNVVGAIDKITFKGTVR